MTADPKVQLIIDWREALTKLDSEHFFELVHVYLGEIQTPFNKQKLIESLSSFLRNKENKEKIVSFLDDDDKKVLSAIKFIKEPSLIKLQNFFSQELPREKFYSVIANLEERLLIYSFENKNERKYIVRINPLLEDAVGEYLSLECLVSPSQTGFKKKDSLKFTEEYFAAFIWYVSRHTDLCKANGELKKKVAEDLCELTGQKDTFVFNMLVWALVNLSVLLQNENGFVLNFNALKEFVRNSFFDQQLYLCAANCGHLTRKSILNNAALLWETLNCIKGNVFTRQDIFKTAYLIREQGNSAGGAATSRFAKLLMKNHSASEDDIFDSSVMKKMLDAACLFGLVQVDADENEKILIEESSLTSEQNYYGEKLLSIDSGFTVTVLRGLSMESLVDIVKFMDVVHCDVTLSLEITKASVVKGFDLGLDKKQIVELLTKYSMYEIPQNLLFSIEEWYNFYSSAALYKGYVLVLNKDKSFYAEKNPGFSKHIIRCLAEGVFLCDFTSNAEAEMEVAKLGLDFNVSIKETVKETADLFFYPVPSPSGIFSFDLSSTEKNSDRKSEDENIRNEVTEELKTALLSMDLTQDQREGLEDRIKRRVILNEEQLRPETVRFELTEASGMDYTSKIRVIERALQDKCICVVEVGGETKYTGIPVSLNKTGEVQLLTLKCDDEEDQVIKIASISYIKRFRKSVFSYS